MNRFTVKQPDGTYHVYDLGIIQEINCCDENNKNWFSLYEGAAIDKLGKYEDEEEQGLLIRLPCKVGEFVWVAKHGEKTRRVLLDCMSDILWVIEHGYAIGYTKEEAEKVLNSR